MTCIHTQTPSAASSVSPAFLQTIPENNEALSNEITRLAAHINAANYRFLKLLAVLVERGAWGDFGIKSPAHWLNLKCGISLGPAREKVRVATPENESFLLTIARYGTASHMEGLVRKYQRVKESCLDGHDKEQRQEREFSWYYDDDGMLVFKGRLTPEDGAVFIKAMDAVMEQTGKNAFPQKRLW